jgi:eukaryotic-like serine/threonine-protein kinase
MRYQIDDQVGDYKITGKLGSGGAGDVFRVEHTITGRVEAMKILYATLDGDRAERILREAKVQARLKSPYITELHHAFWHKGDMILVMEVVEGFSLKEIIARGPIPIATACRYASQLLEGLAHAHAKGVVHRDITPANILITNDGLLKLTDFSLAKDPHDRRVTMAGAMVGTVYYAAPEQIRSGLEADARSDIYSAGVVLYEVFTGRKPFDASTSFQMMMHHAETRPMPPQRLRDDVPAEVDQAIRRAMEKKPDDRFASAEDFRAALQGRERKPLPKAVYAAAATLVLTALGATAINRHLGQPPSIAAPPMPSVAIRDVPLPIGLFASGSLPALPSSVSLAGVGGAPASVEAGTPTETLETPVAAPVPAPVRQAAAAPVAPVPNAKPLKARIYGALTDEPLPASPAPVPATASPAVATADAATASSDKPELPVAEPQLAAPQAAAPQYEIQFQRIDPEPPKGNFLRNMGRRINPFKRKPEPNAVSPGKR